MDLITFIIPTYKGHKFLSQCLASILNQKDIGDFSVYVIENGKKSSKIEEICRQFSKVNFIYTPIKGRSHARNFLLDKIQTPFVAYIDDDVELLSNWAHEGLKSFTSKAIAACGGEIIKSGEKNWFLNFRAKLSLVKNRGHFNSLENSKGIPTINTAACIFRVDALVKVGGFNLHYKRCEDTELSIRLFRAGYAVYSNKNMLAHVYYKKNKFFYLFIRPLRVGYFSGILNFEYNMKPPPNTLIIEQLWQAPKELKFYDSLMLLGFFWGRSFGKIRRKKERRIPLIKIFTIKKNQNITSRYFLNPRYAICFHYDRTTCFDIIAFNHGISFINQSDLLWRKLYQDVNEITLFDNELLAFESMINQKLILKGEL